MNEVYHKALYVTSVVVCEEGEILIRDSMCHEALICCTFPRTYLDQP